MSSFSMYDDVLDFANNGLFNIPEEAKYPIFNQEKAMGIFNKPRLDLDNLIERPLIGEKSQNAKHPEDDLEEVIQNESSFFDFECISPQIDDFNKLDKSPSDSQWLKTADTNKVLSEKSIFSNDEKDASESEDSGVITNEASVDQELQQNVRQPLLKKSRFSMKNSVSIKPVTQQFGVTNEKVSSVRKSSRTKSPKVSSIQSFEESPSSKGVNLAKRKDVVNKTLLRSVKRYYTTLFEKFLKESQYTKQEKREFWRQYVDEFSTTIFGSHLQSTIDSDSEVTRIGVNAFIASMVVPSSIKRNGEEDQCSAILDEFSNLLYKYSIKRLTTFIKNKSVAFVLRHYTEEGPLSNLLETDVTLSKNKHLYMKASREILTMSD